MVIAKKNTYASGSESNQRVLADGSKEFTYELDELKYQDRYFGDSPFIGEEIVWCNQKLIWGMNYYGSIISEGVEAEELYDFLRQALRLVAPVNPFRGPDKFSSHNWEYTNQTSGGVDGFTGVETVYFKGQKVFELKYHGGFVKV